MNKNVLFMLIGACFISISGVCVKMAHVEAAVSAFYRMFLGAAILTPFVIGKLRAQKPAASQLFLLCAAALFFAADLLVWHQSILYVGPGMATLLGNLQVFVLAFFGAMFLKERLPFRFFLALGLAFVGLWLLVGVKWASFGPTYRIGIGLGLATALAYGCYLITMRQAQSKGNALSVPLSIWWMSMLCAALLAAYLCARGKSFAIPDRISFLALFVYAAIAHVLGWIFIVRAMPRLPASTIGLMLLLQPVLAFLWDVLWFSKALGPLEYAGIGLAIGGIFLGSGKK